VGAVILEIGVELGGGFEGFGGREEIWRGGREGVSFVRFGMRMGALGVADWPLEWEGV